MRIRRHDAPGAMPTLVVGMFLRIRKEAWPRPGAPGWTMAPADPRRMTIIDTSSADGFIDVETTSTDNEDPPS